ncbi:MAG: phosphorylcholine transferase LicD [Bulleidia sp.]
MEEYVLKQNPDGTKITVHDVQMVLLEMMKDIDELCRRNDIPYFLSGGSALGAVRHKGFIPWDDDADIFMMRSDFMRFIDVMKEQCPDKYVFQCWYTDKRFNVLIPGMKIRKKGTYLKEVNSLLTNRCTGYEGCDGVFLDVFVWDYATTDKWKDLPPRLANDVLMVPEIIADNVFHINPKGIKSLIMHNAISYSERCEKEHSPYIGFDLTWVWKSPFHPFIFRYDDIFPAQYVPFEDTTLPIAHHPEAYLNTAIAPSWRQLPPENKRFAKHIVDIRL